MAGCRPELGCADACENPARPGSAPQYAEAMDEGATADCCCGFGMWRRTPSHRWTDHRGQHADDDHGRDQPQQTRRGGRGHRGNDLADDGAYEGLNLPEVVPRLAGLTKISRRAMSAPSSGSSKVHAVEQQEIIDEAFAPTSAQE